MVADAALAVGTRPAPTGVLLSLAAVAAFPFPPGSVVAGLVIVGRKLRPHRSSVKPPSSLVHRIHRHVHDPVCMRQPSGTDRKAKRQPYRVLTLSEGPPLRSEMRQ